MKKNIPRFNYKAQKVILQVVLPFDFIFLFLTFYTFILTINDGEQRVKNHCFYTLKKKKLPEKVCCKCFPVEFMPNRVQNFLEHDLNFTMSDYSRTSKGENFATQKITFVTSVL